MGNSTSDMLITKQPKKVLPPQDKKIDTIVGDILNQIIENGVGSIGIQILIDTKAQPV